MPSQSQPPHDPGGPIVRARALLSRARLDEAGRILAAVVSNTPHDLEARTLLATSLLRKGDPEGARVVCLDGLAFDKSSRNCLSILASIAWDAGDMAGAKSRLEEMVRYHPGDAWAQNNLGLCLLKMGDDASAAGMFEAAIAIGPTVPDFCFNLGDVLQNQGRVREAIPAFRRGLQLEPNSVDRWLALASLMVVTGDHLQAAPAFRRAFDLEPGTARGLVAGARAEIFGNEDYAAAEGLLLKAIEVDPGFANAHALLGNVYQRTGALRKARIHLRTAIESDPTSPEPYTDLIGAKRVDEDDLDLVERMVALERDAKGAGAGRALCFAIGKAFDDLGRFEEALRYFDRAQETERERLGTRFDRAQLANAIDSTIHLFPGGDACQTDVPASSSGRPIFIVGMPRSGTTLVEQVLSSHPDVVAGGELDFWVTNSGKALQRGRWNLSACEGLISDYEKLLSKIDPVRPHVTDKMPDNYRLLGLINTLFPKARIIDCHRHPIDNCLSIYMQPFLTPATYAHDKGDLAFAYGEHRRLMRHWMETLPADSILDLDYDQLVEAPEPSIRRLLRFCGLVWDDACLRPESNARLVLTASHWQVRQPIYTTSVGRWRNYEPWLGALSGLAIHQGDR